MAGKREIAPDAQQPKSFAFTIDNQEKAKKIIAKYPSGREQSAVMPLLMLAQRQHGGWVPRAAIEHIGALLGMPFMRVFEVASFYTMYNLAPVGTYHIQCCTTTPCWLRGSDEIVKACEDELGVTIGHSTEDGRFTLSEVECLGACVNAPMMEVTTPDWDRFYEDLTYDSTRKLLKQLRRNEAPDGGSLGGRHSSEPVTGPTTLDGQKKGWAIMKAAG